MKLTVSGAMYKRTRGVQYNLVADILFVNKYGKLTEDNSN